VSTSQKAMKHSTIFSVAPNTKKRLTPTFGLQ